MKIDFHTHGKLAKKLPFSTEYTTLLFQEAKKSGLDALCLTEHFNTLGFHEIYRHITQNYPRQGDSFMVEGVRVFPGMEVDIREGGHILVIGTVESILAINVQLEDYKDKHNFIPFHSLLQLADGYGVLIGGAHPFREGGHIPSLDQMLLKKLSFIDLNAKDYAMKGLDAKTEVLDFAHALDLPVVAGSDTHQFVQYGSIWNTFEQECTTINELKDSISLKKYKIQVSDYIEYKVKTAGVLKKALKEIHKLGGNYVSVLNCDE